MFDGCLIVTVGICPAWDIVCFGENLEWGRHSLVSQARTVAGKAFNVSRALGWMEKSSIAAGLWGEVDFAEMLMAVESVAGFVDVRFTRAAGHTRENFTVVDKNGGREIHLRTESLLASSESLLQLEKDLRGIIDAESVCVFAGSLPGGELFDEVISVIESVKNIGAKIVVDTSGASLAKIVTLGGLEILKPNLDELRGLLGVNIKDDPTEIAGAAKGLLDKANMIIVTRAENGAVVVTKDRVLQGRCVTENKILSTVGCGDYFLAGFLSGTDLKDSLAKGLKAGAARAWGQSANRNWTELENEIEVEIKWM